MKNILLFNCIVLSSLFSNAQTAGDYRSAANGNWNAIATWEVFTGTAFVASTVAPTSTDGVITIKTGHTVTVSSSIITDQTIVEAGATLIQNADINLANNTGDDLVVNGIWDWNISAISNPGTVLVSAAGTLNIATGNIHQMFTNISSSGTINWQDGDIYFGNDPILANGGTMIITSNNSAQNNNSQGAVNNSGTITKLSTGVTRFTVNNGFINIGTMNCNGGIVDFTGTYTNNGSFNLGGGTFNITSLGSFIHNAVTPISGTGNFNNAGTFGLSSNQVFPSALEFGNTGTVNGAGNLTINSACSFTGNISGSGTLTLNANSNWNGGAIARSAIIPAGVTLNIATASIHQMFADITNGGTINWQDGDIYFGNNPTLVNNGTMFISGNNAAQTNTSQGAINNSGTITKVSTGTTAFIANNGFVNSGTFTCNTGIINIDGTFNNSGIIAGTGIFNMNTSFVSNGSVAPGNSPGVLTFNVSQPLSANSNLQIEMFDGSGAGAGHDQLQRNGNLTLAGTLTITETGTVPDGTYTIINLTAGAMSGYFTTINKPAGYTLVVNSNNVQVVKGSIPVNPLLPGSGNAISFDGVNDVIQIPNAANNDFTYELWIKTAQVGPNPGSPAFSGAGILSSDIGSTNTGDFTPMALNGNFISFGTGDPEITLTSTIPINDNKWHHVAVTRDKTTLTKKIFIDGIENATGSCSNLSYNLNPNIYIGADVIDNVFFNGSLDEIRVWNKALTETEIRDRMCHKITSSDVLYSNLVAYYNFDESTGIITFDGTGNANYGVFINDPVRVTSGAAIGAASSHDYVNATKTTSLTHPTGESFTVTTTSGNPDGIQIYRVDEQPNTLNGAVGVGANDKYFGVFQAGGSTPQYTAVYNYNGNPGVNTGNEFQLRLNKRTGNAATTWSIVINVPDELANTITVTGESTEYILGKLGAVLPVNILSFTGTLKNQSAELQWKVTDEINIAQFVIECSNGATAFRNVGTRQPLNNGTAIYSLTDNNPFTSGAVQYYRLKIIDKEGRFKYSNIIRISNAANATLSIFPNPVKDLLTISGLQKSSTIKIISADGKIMQQQIVTAQTITLDMSNYAKGIYLLQYAAGGEVESQKIIKQ
jgi:hypothetical protein